MRALTNEGTSALHYVCRAEIAASKETLYLAVLKKMVEKGAEINCQNKFGETPLHQSCYKARIKCINYLLEEKGIDIHLKTKFARF